MTAQPFLHPNGEEFAEGEAPLQWALPHDEDAERAVLGAAMLSPAALAEVRPMLTGADFYVPKHEQIWEAIAALADTGRPADPLVVAQSLGEQLHRIGGAPYLHTCMASVPTAGSAGWWAQILLDKAYARRVIQAATRLGQIGRSEDMDAPLRARVRAEYAALLEAETKGWTDPTPLGKATGTLPEFPGDALPKWVAEKVAAVADETQTPMDLAASVALGCLATACGGKVRVMVRPRIRWSVPTNLYLVTALAPGTRKSPVFNAMVAPLLEAEKLLQQQARPVIVQAMVDRQIAEQRAAHAATAAAKAKPADRAKLEAEARDAAAALDETSVPSKPRLVADDVTPETAATMLAEQNGRLAVLSAESEIFTIMAGRYGGQASLNVFLKGHAGDLLRVDRRGREESIEEPALTMGICTQPSVLRELAAVPGASGRGLLGRWLYALPIVNFGERVTDPEPAEPTAHANYAAQLHSLTLTMAEREEPIELTLSTEAMQVERDMSDRYEKRVADDGDLAGIRDWASKAVGHAMRIAGLLHVAEHLRDGYGAPISAETVANAVRIMDYFTTHALAAFDAMSTDESIVRARAVLEWLERNRPDRFTARQAFTAAYRQRFPKIADMDAALLVLERHGYIRRLPDPPTGPRGGRPSAPTYETHPDVGT